jgi:MFS family permease
VFTLGRATYLIYLPKLAAEVGIAPGVVILILMLDQAIFTITDTAMGIAADRIGTLVGRLSVFVGALTALFCAAALHCRRGRKDSSDRDLAISSSALRAPPLTLLGKYCARPQLPFLAALVMLGYTASREPRRPIWASCCAMSTRDFHS